jgi:Lysophospholipase
LIIHGKEDTVTDYEASIKFYYKISTEHKDIKIFEDGYHEIHHDNDRELLHKFMLEFLQKRLQSNNLKNIGFSFHFLRLIL